jgi:hypothetical protein
MPATRDGQGCYCHGSITAPKTKLQQLSDRCLRQCAEAGMTAEQMPALGNENFASARQLELLALRSFQLADRVASGELQFLDAVDVAFDSAVASGLADKVGYDVIQVVLATAFKKVRP